MSTRVYNSSILTHSRSSLAVADGLYRASLLAPAVHMKERRDTARIEGRPGPQLYRLFTSVRSIA